MKPRTKRTLGIVLGISLACLGCNRAVESEPILVEGEPPAIGHEGADAHAHAESGPHGGRLIELGRGEYHAELVRDESASRVMVYLLDRKASGAVASDAPELTLNLVIAGQPRQVKVSADRQTTDPEGQASRYSTNDASVLEALHDTKTNGRLLASVAGKQFSGALTPHDHHSHRR